MSFRGRHYRIPQGLFLRHPLQKPRPALWIGGNSRCTDRRTAEFGDAWHPTKYLAPKVLLEEMNYIGELAGKLGRNPDRIALTIRWNASPELTKNFLASEVIQKLYGYREIGVEHVCFDLNIPQPSSVEPDARNHKAIGARRFCENLNVKE
jgi:alkanesulfonate monooxygenase SsuD/methylene tetrahydromethanopterin reductase-like flavin-dependent oxidoreductase (luciferase family)